VSVIDGGEGGDFILGDTGDTLRLGQGGGMNVPGDDVIDGGTGDGRAGEGGKRPFAAPGVVNFAATA
jgi:hypothetical protein